MPAYTGLIETLSQIEKEKGIDKEVIFEAIESSLISACKKNFGTSQNIRVAINRENGDVDVFAQKTVVEKPDDDILEISLIAAKEIDIEYELGDIVEIAVTPRNFGRISAQTAKQVVVQKFREAERNKLFNDFKDKESQVVTGIVQRTEGSKVFVSINNVEFLLLPAEQIPNERYYFNQRLKLIVLEVKHAAKGGPVVNISRSHPNLVSKLLEQEIPELLDETVVIKAVSREAGSRSKVLVYSNNPDVDPVGACVGSHGQRIAVIVNELSGEKIDIIRYSENIEDTISASLSPSSVIAVKVDEKERNAKVIVPDNQLSLAIGRSGQNVRLAARITGYRIDIKSYSQALQENIIDTQEQDEQNMDASNYENSYEEYYDEYDEYDEYDDEYYDDYEDDEYYDDYEGYNEDQQDGAKVLLQENEDEEQG